MFYYFILNTFKKFLSQFFSHMYPLPRMKAKPITNIHVYKFNNAPNKIKVSLPVNTVSNPAPCVGGFTTENSYKPGLGFYLST